MILEFKIERKLISIKFKDETSVTFLIDTEQTTKELLQLIQERIALPPQQVNHSFIHSSFIRTAWNTHHINMGYSVYRYCCSWPIMDFYGKDIQTTTIASKIFGWKKFGN